MKARLRRLMPGTLVLLCGLLGYWLVQDAAPAPSPPSPRKDLVATPRQPLPEAPKPTKSFVRDRFPDGTTIEIFGSCHEEELILRFPTEASYNSFLYALNCSSVRLIDRLDPLRAVRIGFNAKEMEVLTALFEDEQITTYKTLTRLPEAPRAWGGASQGAVAFGSQVLPWLGVTGDNSRWGSGVKLAVLDTGIVAHPALPRIARSIEIFPFSDDPATTHFHGTAIASLIAGNDPMVHGVAPAVDLISVRVLDDRGVSDSFAIAAGILAAMDAGAEILNLSLGEQSDSPLVGDAIHMAIDRGIVVVASSGNEGLQEAKYPAAYPGVIGVGAVDASGERMAFSNLGSGLGITAPGYGLNAAAPGGGYLAISGTSASAPLVAAAIAAVMSDGSGRRVSAAEAAKLVLAYTDDEGLPGPDAEYGSGVLNLGRVMNRSIPGLSDAVITNLRLVPTSSGSSRDEVQLTVQNRGTATLINTLVEITTPAGTTSINATTIPACSIQTFTVPFNAQRGEGRISASVSLGNSAIDLTPQNNFIETAFSRS
ncbi:S8 family peptidase [Luteolibacter soli]|uniref:S8 family serine peptidase n=1 Tax=Luteolibacter soli TaxID=3135280 RepID=A0ABU9AQU6_9BACT